MERKLPGKSSANGFSTKAKRKQGMKAIIDLGTNTFHLLLAGLDANNRIIEHHKLQLPVKLGEGGINKQVIQPEPYKRGLAAIGDIKAILSKHECDEVFAFATSAIRSAQNGNEFVMEVKEKFDIDVKVISGDEEAELIYNGVKHAIKLTEEKVLIMDIGGGSVEFVIANEKEIFWKESFPIGAARLIDRFHTEDPITEDDQRHLKHFFDKELLPLRLAMQQYKISTLIGSAGSFESVVDLVENFFEKKLHFNTSCQISIPEFKVINHVLVNSSKQERLEMPGLASFRVEMIVVASIMTNYVIDQFNISKLYCSDFSLKEGILFRIFNL